MVNLATVLFYLSRIFHPSYSSQNATIIAKSSLCRRLSLKDVLRPEKPREGRREGLIFEERRSSVVNRRVLLDARRALGLPVNALDAGRLPAFPQMARCEVQNLRR